MPDEEVQMYTLYRGGKPVAYRYGPPWMAARLWIDGSYPTEEEALAEWEREKEELCLK